MQFHYNEEPHWVVKVFAHSLALGGVENLLPKKGKVIQSKRSSMEKIKEKVPLAPLTTLKIGGAADFFSEAETAEEVKEAVDFAKQNKLNLTVIGGGSNLLVADEGVRGLVLQVKTRGQHFAGKMLTVGAGEILDEVIRNAVPRALSGLEHLADIPGSVGGAIYGNAGAYGREMKDLVTRVLIFDGAETRELANSDCSFAYRESIFRKKPWIILEATLELFPSHREVIERIADGYRAHREFRYGKGLKVPGSFFKNAEVKNIAPEILSRIPRFAISNNKVQAGWLLEQSGALGACRGGIRIAPFHGNLFINERNGSAADFIALAEEYWRRVYEKFGILLEPEVQLLGFSQSYFDPAALR